MNVVDAWNWIFSHPDNRLTLVGRPEVSLQLSCNNEYILRVGDEAKVVSDETFFVSIALGTWEKS